MADVEECRLFLLPAELRNHIYRLVLVEEDPIVVTSTGHDRPGLLASSRSIRAEALDIYYSEKKFHTMAPSNDLAAVTKLRVVLADLDVGYDDLISIIPNYAPHWNNIMTWLRLFHAREICGWARPTDMVDEDGIFARTDLLVVSGMFTAVKAIEDQAWEKVEELLKVQRPILAAIDSEWDEDKRA